MEEGLENEYGRVREGYITNILLKYKQKGWGIGEAEI